MEVLVFGGTSEGRALVEWLDARGSAQVVACTATAYGASLLAGGAHVSLVEGPLSARQKDELVAAHDFACIVDATHPYALHISDSIAEMGRAYGLDVIRVVRGEAAGDGGWTSVASVGEAGGHLSSTAGNVLLTTGSKDLAAFVRALGDPSRLYVRVLPVVGSLERAAAAGVPASHVIAMQGPFSQQLNEALIREFGIRHLVTKQSGSAGGFDEKARAAQACGIELVVVERPRQESGLSFEAAQALLEERYGL